MSARKLALLSLAAGPLAALGGQLLDYGLVYVARDHGTKRALFLGTMAAAALAGAGLLLAQRVHRRASLSRADRFVALLGMVLNAFFLFVVVAGYGLPALLHRLAD
ncbi:hypothetical protein LZC95_00865 [Pendulispora brunnea]|uniref:Uncharacterized protein n=1 Tax=Pendulispora brunnea TaxID=2905690 RepID=A0ABZ2KG85_9BACT